MRFLSACILLSATPALAQPSFAGLGLLPGGDFSEAAAVSADGSVIVGGASTETGGTQAFRWTFDSGLVPLGVLPGGTELSEAYGVSAGGSTIVGSSDSGTGIRAVRWDDGGGPEEIDPDDGTSSLAYGVSGSGKFAVGYVAGGDLEAARWLGGGATDLLGFVPGDGPNTIAFTASFDGSVVAGGGDPTPFVWTSEGGIVGLGLLPGADGDTPGAAYAASTDGSILAGAVDSDTNLQAFRWTQESGLVGLGQMGGFASAGFGMSGDGRVIAGFILGFGGPEAFIWDEKNGMRSMQDVLAADYGLADSLDGWSLQNATAVSADGLTIVGVGTHEFEPNHFRSEGWVAHLGAGCYPDFTGDGTLDLFDFLAYVNAFNAGDMKADCDGSGVLDLFDFLCFVNAFNAGC